MAKPDRAVLLQQIDQLYRGGTSAGVDDAQLVARYVRDRDEAAFEALVRRHGPMVLGLCRRALRDHRDVEDAFQATFLVLARKAASIRNGAVVSSWLYGVAQRVATRRRAEVLRRRAVEVPVEGIDLSTSDPRPSDELAPVLDQELSRLPEKYRMPIVLCYLREQTHDQAAAELKWPVGTVRSRLARGRELLRGRLTRRGWTPADAMLGLAPRAFSPPVPRALVEATLASAGRFLGGSTMAIVPAVLSLSSNLTGTAPRLAQGVLTTMAMTQFTWIGSGLATLTLVAGGMGAGAWAVAARGQAKPGDPPAAVAKPVDTPKPTEARAASAPAVAAGADSKDVSARLDQLERKLDQLLQTLNPPRPSSLDPISPAVAEVPAGLSDPSASPTSRLAPAVPASHPGPAMAPVPGPEPDDQLMPPPARSSDVPRPSQHVPLPASAVRDDDLFPRPEDPAVETPSPVSRPTQPRLRQRPPATTADPSIRQEPDLFESQPSPQASLREIEARVLIARRKVRRNRELLKQAAISRREAEEPVDELLLLQSRLGGMEEDINDRMAQGRSSLARLQAELDRAKAQLETAKSVTARNQRLNNVRPNMVSPEDVARADAEALAAGAGVAIRVAELQGAQTRLKQGESRGQRIHKLLEEIVAAVPELTEISDEGEHAVVVPGPT